MGTRITDNWRLPGFRRARMCAGAALVYLAACGNATPAPKPVQTGPYNVGLRQWETTYTPAPGMAERTITVNLWYPTHDVTGETGRYIGLWNDDKVLADATVAPPADGKRYPVIAYSHGHLGWAGTGAHLMRYMAAQGWLAIGPDHKGNTTIDNLDPRPTAIYIQRPRDVSAVLDALGDLPAVDPLAGKTALDKVILGAHSFGTYGAWALAGATYDMDAVRARCDTSSGGDLELGCTEAELAAFAAGFRDERIIGVMNTGGSFGRDWYGATGHATVTIPVLDMSGTADGAHSGSLEKWDSLKGLDLTWVVLEGGCHSSFETSPIECDTLSKIESHRIQNIYSSAFATVLALGGRPQELLDILSGKTSISSFVSVQRR